MSTRCVVCSEKIANILFVLLIIGFISLASSDVGDLCGDKLTGKCILVTDCKPAEEALRKRKHHGLERCGFKGDLEIVCCNEHRDVLVRRPDTRKSIIACKDFQNEISVTPFILGGINVSLGEYPHMASLGYEDETKDDYLYECGGALISDTYVLTAAHCLVRQDGKVPKIVRFGTVDILGEDDVKPQDIPVAEVFPHDDYSWHKRVHDIALVRLTKPIERNGYVKPICLHMKDDDPPELIVCGFGKMGNTREGSRFLLKTSLAPVNINDCNNTAQTRIAAKPVFDTQICATSSDDTSRDTCEGDSGGPMFIESKQVKGVSIPASLVGITSYGPLCGSKFPSIYTRVSKYINWIEEKVWP
ncbi:serine protease Hayan-like [Onthophagus taurus]|uniref:serine protease Hayan-like n=1 Tax=Onthophagus taurus TaxID=166361 RepID=UPI000C20658A|nr:serine protease Hayan-like [Onthophagus taurus]